jgi:predicted O-linked N-acetylglucosamine transferase (SPINDLY family)
MPDYTLTQALESAVAHHQAGRLAEAEQLYRQILARFPDHPDTLHLLGVLAGQAGNPGAAIVLIERACALNPGIAAYHGNLGESYLRAGRPEDSLASFRRAIELEPASGLAHCRLGAALWALARHEESIGAFHRATVLEPAHAPFHNDLGSALKDRWRIDEAITALRGAIALAPDRAEAYSNLGSALLAHGDVEQAVVACTRALELDPGFATAHSNLLLCSHYQHSSTLASLARDHAAWDERHAAPLRARWQPCDPDRRRDPERPLRLGFVSADFCRHAVGFLLVGLLENLDRGSFEVIGYANRRHRDDLTERIAATACQWRDVATLSDDALAAQIRADGVDILFDLSGHTAGNRLLVFVRRPAPLQVTWIGYVGTTGLDAIDYLIADRYHVPDGSERYYRETVVQMPDGYVCFDPPAEAPDVRPLPALSEGCVTFGSVSNLAKLNSDVIATWAEIVQRVERGRLLLVSPSLGSAAARARIEANFTAAGGDRSRLELKGPLPRGELLAAYNTVDLALDPFPYSGGVTTCEALWMGVPVVTCPGETFASRHALSHLSNAGLTETIALDRRDYVERAVATVHDLPRLAALRAELRGRVARSPLCDGPRFARHFMALCRHIWRRRCAS